MAGELRFWIGNSATLQQQILLTKISGASINLQLNNGGTVSLTVDKNDISTATASNFNPISSCIMVFIDGIMVWSGPIWTVEETNSDSAKKVTIRAIGWYELLNHRLIRSTPGYVLTTSAITWSNGTYESAVSGWAAFGTTSLAGTGGSSGSYGPSSFGSTTTRDTVVFHGGAGSFLWSENLTGPFGASIGFVPPAPNLSGTTIIGTSAAPLSGTPTNGKRYKLNLWLRARKTPTGTGGSTPLLQILENGTVVATQSLQALFNTTTYNTYFDGSNFINPTNIIGSPIASFTQYSIEWVATGFASTFRFIWDVNPSQLASLYSGWVGPNNYRVVGSLLVFSTSTGVLSLGNGAWNGTFENGKVYKVTVRWNPSGSAVNAGSTFSIRDLATGVLGSVSISGVTLGVTRTDTFTFTASTGQIYFLVNASFAGTGDEMTIYEISISENANNTDALLNLDDVTLQEYAGDGIYNNMDAGAIAMALLGKANSDGATKIIPGTVQTTQPRTRTYQQFSNVGKEITALSQIESGYDFWIDPSSRALNVYNRTNATNFPVSSAQASGPSYVYSADRTNFLRFEYGYGSDNLKSIKKTQDGSTIVNRLNVQGKYALGQASDATSQSTYGIFEDLVSLPDVIDASTSILPFYANAEIQFRKNPKIIYDVELKAGDMENSPKLFIDFNIGDRAVVRAGLGVFMSGQLTQTVRIFGCQVSVDSEGNQALSGIQMSA